MLKNTIIELKNTIFSKRLGEYIKDYGMKTFKFPSLYLYKVLRINESHCARPDKLSYDLYGLPQYGDILCKINNIPNPFELNTDSIIVAPSFEFLEDFIIENASESDDENNENLPKPKGKKDKRKACDSIIGDIRFKVDNTKRVIIY